ncbi:MAG: fibronectin type III domain-containing protein [Candidatus Thermoplasmatota archaeon]|nr:fibronectin type III domain-containing protein [Candidatus Thermoplasmatota archaeon]
MNETFIYPFRRATTFSFIFVLSLIAISLIVVIAENTTSEGKTEDYTLNPPAPPEDVGGYVVENHCKIVWMPPKNMEEGPVDTYRIYRNGSSEDPVLYDEVNSDIILYHDYNIKGGETYCYWVSSVNKWGESERVRTRKLSIKGIPDPVGSISLSSEEGSVNITWATPMTAGGFGEIVCDVQRAGRAGLFESIFIISAQLNTTYTHTDNSVTNGVSYFYKVVIKNEIGTSENNSIAQTYLTGPPSYVVQMYETPSVGKISIRWDPPANNGGSEILGYIIKKGRTKDDLREIEQVDVNTTQWMDNDPYLQGDNWYSIRAYNAFGEGEETIGVAWIKRDYHDEFDSTFIIFLSLLFIPGLIVGSIAFTLDLGKAKNDCPDHIGAEVIDVPEYTSSEDKK